MSKNENDKVKELEIRLERLEQALESLSLELKRLENRRTKEGDQEEEGKEKKGEEKGQGWMQSATRKLSNQIFLSLRSFVSKTIMNLLTFIYVKWLHRQLMAMAFKYYILLLTFLKK